MRSIRFTLLSLVLLLAEALPALADNSAQRHRTMTCAWSFAGDSYSIDMAELDATTSSGEKAALEVVLLNDSMREMAGKYHHEYADYPNAPATVHKADMVGWRCTWTENG